MNNLEAKTLKANYPQNLQEHLKRFNFEMLTPTLIGKTGFPYTYLSSIFLQFLKTERLWVFDPFFILLLELIGIGNWEGELGESWGKIETRLRQN